MVKAGNATIWIMTPQDKIGALRDIAAGMAHLLQHGVVHRDLASRNVLVDSEKRMKVADFGLSRATAGRQQGKAVADQQEETYYRTLQGHFPIRHTAPEAMMTGKFTSSTDVWSYGIVCIEVYTNGALPYQGMANEEVWPCALFACSFFALVCVLLCCACFGREGFSPSCAYSAWALPDTLTSGRGLLLLFVCV